MVTSVIGKIFLEAYNEKHNKTYTPNKTGKTKSTKLQNEKYRINKSQQQNEKYKGGAKKTRHLLFYTLVNRWLSSI